MQPTNPLTAYMEARTKALECVSRIYADEERTNPQRWDEAADLHYVAATAAQRAIKDLQAAYSFHRDQITNCRGNASTQRREQLRKAETA